MSCLPTWGKGKCQISQKSEYPDNARCRQEESMGFSRWVKLWQLKCVAVRETLWWREVYYVVYRYLPSLRCLFDRNNLEFCFTWVMYQSSVAPPASPQRPNTSLQEKISSNQPIKILYLTSLATWQCPAHIVPQCEQRWLGWCRWQERPRALGVRVAASSKYIIKCFPDLTQESSFPREHQS